MESPRLENSPAEDLEGHHSLRLEKNERADREIAAELRQLFTSIDHELSTRTTFELNGREWEMVNESDCIVAKKLALVEGMQTLVEEKRVANNYFGEKLAAKMLEYAQVDLELALRRGELEQEHPITAKEMQSNGKHIHDE